MFGLFKKKTKPTMNVARPKLTAEDRAVLAGVFTRAGIVEPTAEDLEWGANLWAQGARDPDELDRVLRVRLDFIAAQHEAEA